MDWFDVTFSRDLAIPFAWDAEGRWRDVSEVERGLQCRCFCPACRGPLVAKKGTERTHHFAHHDRRECRHALESSLFGMAVNLLESAGSVLMLPGHCLRTDLAREMGVRFSESQGDRFFRHAWVVEPETIFAEAGFVVTARSLAESTLEAADLILPKEKLKVHLLTYKKSLDQIRALVPEPGWKILAINLRYYANLWWERCDEDKDQRIAEAKAAKGLMAKWLADQDTGRGFLYHAEFERRKSLLADLVRRQKEEDAVRLAAESREKAKRMAAQKAVDAHWTIPNSTGSDLIAATLRPSKGTVFFKPAKPEEVAQLTSWLASNMGLVWIPSLSKWGFAGIAGSVVPEHVRAYLDSDAEWAAISSDCVPNSRASSEGRDSKGSSKLPANDPDEPAEPDTILSPAVSACVICKSPVDEVIFGSGYYRGRRGWRCSASKVHPTRIL